jgi:ribosome-binding ATPase YchF (GTP1/OBG family)
VPDPRIDALSKMFSPKKTTFAEMSFSDIPGEHGAEKKGLSVKALQQIRDQDALCLVLRDFANPALEGDADPMRDLEAFHLECVFADLTPIERRLHRALKEKMPPQEHAAFELMKTTLEDGRPLRSLSPAQLDRGLLTGYGFLTDRPLLVALNRSEERAAEPLPADIATRLRALDAAGLTLSASVEAEIATLAPVEQAAFLADLVLPSPRWRVSSARRTACSTSSRFSPSVWMRCVPGRFAAARARGRRQAGFTLISSAGSFGPR